MVSNIPAPHQYGANTRRYLCLFVRWSYTSSNRPLENLHSHISYIWWKCGFRANGTIATWDLIFVCLLFTCFQIKFAPRNGNLWCCCQDLMFVCSLLMGFLGGSAGPFSHRLYLLKISKIMAQTFFNVIYLTRGPQKLASMIRNPEIWRSTQACLAVLRKRLVSWITKDARVSINFVLSGEECGWKCVWFTKGFPWTKKYCVKLCNLFKETSIGRHASDCFGL